MKLEMERLHKISKEKETLLQKCIGELQMQVLSYASKKDDMTDHLEVVRQREHGYKREWHKSQKEIEQLKTHYEDQLHKAQRAREEAETEARLNQLSLNNEISEYRLRLEKMEMVSIATELWIY